LAHALVGDRREEADADARAGQPRGARVLGVTALEVIAERPLATRWRARVLQGPDRGKDVALVVVAENATLAVRERFAQYAEDLQAAGDVVSGILRVHAVARSRDAFVADLWTTGTARDLSALRWPLRRRLELVCQVARSLESLHAIGMFHGCLCCENVLIDDDLNPVLAEVGLASPAVVGDTPSYAEYASPEVKAGEEPGARSDVFSVGRVLQEIVRGDETPEVAEVVRTCLAPPAARYASAAEVERALAAVAERLPEDEPQPTGRRAPAALAARASRERALQDKAVPERGSAGGAISVLGRQAPIVGALGLVAIGIATGGAFFVGGSEGSIRMAFAACLALGAAGATWLLPAVPRATLAARLVLASACATLLAVVDPLGWIYAGVAARHLHGSEAARRAAIDEIVRLGRDFRGISLSSVDLSSMDLSGADLRGVDLSRADLSQTRLWGAEVEGASFDGARLEGADLDRTNLGQAQVGSATCNAATRLPSGWRCDGAHVTR
jgi:hypothetical protein